MMSVSSAAPSPYMTGTMTSLALAQCCRTSPAMNVPCPAMGSRKRLTRSRVTPATSGSCPGGKAMPIL